MNMQDLLKIDMAQLSKNKNIMANVGIIILAIFITFNLHKAQVQKINILKDRIVEENNIIGALGELGTLEDEINSLKSGFPTELTSDIVIEKISSIAGKQDVRINSVDSQQIIDKELYQLLPIKVKLKADYHNLGHLISDIEKTGIFKVKKLEIKSAAGYSSERGEEKDFSLELVAVTLKK